MTGIAHVPYLEHRKPGFLYWRRIPARLLHPTARNSARFSPSRNTNPGSCLCVCPCERMSPPTRRLSQPA